jgi:hypothetical protein
MPVRLVEESEVSELKINVNCKSMLISTAFFRFCKGIEHCYYTLLFTSEPYDRAGAKPWLSWLELGFHLAAREAPPDAAEADRLSLDTRPGRNFEVRASTTNTATLERLDHLLHELDRIRGRLGAADDRGRLAVIVADAKIEEMLLAPLGNSLARNAIGPEGSEACLNAIHRGLLAICHPQISSIEASWR